MAEKESVTNAVEKHLGGEDVVHLASHGHQHVYAGDSSRDDARIHMHDEKTGKTTTHEFEPGDGDKPSASTIKKHLSGAHPTLISKVHKNWHGDMNEEYNEDLDEASAADTLKPGAGSGGGDTKAEMLSTFTSMLAQLGKEDLSKFFNDAQAVFGPNKAPGAEDKAASNRSTVDMKPSAAVGKGTWKEDIDDMFGDDLTEDFKEKAEVVFEAALNTRVTLEVARIEEEFAAKEVELEEAFAVALEEQTMAAMDEVTTKLDQYLDYCVEQWMEDNKLAIENSLRADITEDFMEALRNVFAEHYIAVPDEKIDIVAEMKAELDDLRSKLNETVDAKIALEAIIEEATKEAAFEEVSDGLAQTQVEKLKTLAEGIDYSDADAYRKKLEIVKEQYFTKKSAPASTGLITEEIDGEDDTANGTTGFTAPGMDKYVQAIAKAVK